MVVLHSNKSLEVRASWDDSGQLVIHGQDLNPPPMLGREYEYWLAIPKDQLHLVASDIGAKSADQDALLRQLAVHGNRIAATGEITWLKNLGVSAKFSSWFSD